MATTATRMPASDERLGDFIFLFVGISTLLSIGNEREEKAESQIYANKITTSTLGESTSAGSHDSFLQLFLSPASSALLQQEDFHPHSHFGLYGEMVLPPPPPALVPRSFFFVETVYSIKQFVSIFSRKYTTNSLFPSTVHVSDQVHARKTSRNAQFRTFSMDFPDVVSRILQDLLLLEKNFLLTSTYRRMRKRHNRGCVPKISL